MARVLLIEDEPAIAKLIVAELSDAGCVVDWVAGGIDGLAKLGAKSSDLVVLDLNLPDIDGLNVCERIRSRNDLIPILMLTARATKQDVVRGLELGADDYLTKPFDTKEFKARVRALLRRTAESGPQAPGKLQMEAIQRGTMSIDPRKREIRISGRPVELTAKELELLLLFARHPGRTFSRDELLGRVWGDGFEGYEHTVNTHINRLRNKVEKDPRHPAFIETVWGIGYRFSSPASE